MVQKSNDVRDLIIFDIKNGVSYRKIKEKYQISLAGISKLAKKYAATGSVARQLGSGRKRGTSKQTDRSIYRLSRFDPSKSCRIIKEELNLDVSTRTISNRLRERGLKSFFKLKKPLLRKVNIKKRMEFAKKYAVRPMSFWKSVIWTDESKFELRGAKKRERVRCLPSERLQQRFTHGTVKHGGGSLLVWGCFSYSGVGNIVKIDGKMTGESYVRIIDENLKSSAEKMGVNAFVFQQDNDPKHTSRVAQSYFVENEIEMLDWPPQSPDLNPIEHLWAILDDKIPLASRRNLSEFWKGIQTAWASIPEKTLQNLVESIPRRLQAVIESRGGHIKC